MRLKVASSSFSSLSPRADFILICTGALLVIAFPSSSQEFIQEHSIQLHHLGVHYTSNAWDPLTEDAVMKAL